MSKPPSVSINQPSCPIDISTQHWKSLAASLHSKASFLVKCSFGLTLPYLKAFAPFLSLNMTPFSLKPWSNLGSRDQSFPVRHEKRHSATLLIQNHMTEFILLTRATKTSLGPRIYYSWIIYIPELMCHLKRNSSVWIRSTQILPKTF